MMRDTDGPRQEADTKKSSNEARRGACMLLPPPAGPVHAHDDDDDDTQHNIITTTRIEDDEGDTIEDPIDPKRAIITHSRTHHASSAGGYQIQ